MDQLGPETTRRGFVNWFLGTSGGALLASVLYPVVRYLSPPHIAEATTSEVEAGPVNDPDFLERGYKIVPFGAEPVIVIRLSDTEFRAFTATCTHLDCIVEFHAKQEVIWCNCHNGSYDLTGRNIAGPPPKPLQQLTVHLVEGRGGQAGKVVVQRS